MGNGNRPTPEFRREAVRLALTSGRTRREIADDLGIGLSTLTRWVRQDREVSRRLGVNSTWAWHDRKMVGDLAKAADGGIHFIYTRSWLEDENAFPVASVRKRCADHTGLT